MPKPLVSIVMPTYNNDLYLKQAIESVLYQTFLDWEFIIINDASPDSSDSILREYAKKDKRIIYVKNQKNLGFTKNLNMGIKLSQGEFIARLDSDDYWTNKTKLQQQISFLIKNPDHGMVGCLGYAVDTSGKKLFEIVYPSKDEDIRKIILKHNCFLHNAVVFRKTILSQINNYDLELTTAQDYDIYLRIGKISKFHNIPKFMVDYRVNPQGTSQTQYRKQIEEAVKIITKHKSSFPSYFSGYILWQVRKYYPAWFRGAPARNIKKKFPTLHKLSGA